MPYNRLVMRGVLLNLTAFPFEKIAKPARVNLDLMQ